MSRLSEVSSSPMVVEYAQGAAQRAINPVAEFIAPTVNVATSVGKYKIYTEKHRFKIPNTKRDPGGRAVSLSFEASDGQYNCQAHAIDYPVDVLESDETADLENLLQEGSQAIAEVAALEHEQSVITAAVSAAGAGIDKTWNSAADPVDDIDTQIIAVLKAAKYGSLMKVGVLFGVTAWKVFKNSAGVRGKIVVGAGAKSPSLAIPTEEITGSLLLGNPDVRTSYMVADTAAEGLTENMAFLLDSKVLIFARSPAPTRRDPSFMKTFRRMGRWMVPGSYVRDDGRSEVAKFDWSEDVKVTNSAAVKMLNIT